MRKAKNYLESSLGIKPITETYLQLATLLRDKMEEPDKADQYYKLGLELAVAEQYGKNSQAIDAGLSVKESAPVLKVIQ